MHELLLRAAAAEPDAPAILTHEESVGHPALVRRAEAVASGLAERGVERFAVLDHDAATVVAVLAGASMAGAEACLYPPTDDADEVARLAERFDHEVIVSHAPAATPVPTVIDPGELLAAGSTVRPATDLADRVPGARPHLVLTTGTTGEPRGVRHDWARLVRGVDPVKPAPGERWLLAYGLHQFAGLQVLLHVLAAGATLVAPAPRRPREGLRAMRELGVTHASATPTYWRFLLAELRSDGGPAPELRQVTLGGEAVPGPLLEQIGEAFPEARVSQVYAASEFGATSSMRDGRPGLSTAVLERGEDADVAVKVVDGELWVRSRTGMLGYHGEQPVDADGWRPTGDLVEVDGDRIVFRGRAGDVINVGGVKVHPLPIEERVAGVPGVALARVHGRPNPMTGAIVAVEVVPEAGADTDAVDAAVRDACADLPAAARPRRVRFVSELSTAGGKIVRRDPHE